MKSAASAVELLIARDDLISKIDGIELDEGTQISEILKENKGKISEIVRGMGVGRQRQVYDAVKETFPETWSSELISTMEGSGARAIGEITKYLSDFEKDDELSDHLNT